MATTSMTKGGGGTYLSTAQGKGITVITETLDVAAWVTAKGTALANADIAQVINLPIGSIILGGCATVTTAFAGTSIVGLQLDIGTATTAKAFVDAADPTSTGVCAVGSTGSAGFTVVNTAAQKVNVKITQFTSGTLSTGVIRIDVIVADVGVSDRG